MGEADDWAARIAASRGVSGGGGGGGEHVESEGVEDGGDGSEEPFMEVISEDGQEAAGRSQSATGVEAPIKKRTLVRWASEFLSVTGSRALGMGMGMHGDEDGDGPGLQI